MNEKMQKEISEQPEVFDKIVKSYIKDERININFPAGFSEVKFIASGSSYNCGRLGQKFFENVAGIKASFEYSSEFNSNVKRPISKDVLYFFISQSGETYDSKVALNIVKQGGGVTFALVNNSNSTIYNLCDYKMDIKSGLEESIAATKSFLGGVLCLWLTALFIAQNKGVDIKSHIDNLKTIKNDISKVLENVRNIEIVANKLSELKSFPFIGYGYGYVAAKEGALKIKETSYIDVNAYPTGEFLHGHTAILNENSVILELVFSDASDFELKTLEKINNDYHPKTIVITDSNTIKGTLETIGFNCFNDEITKILSAVVVLQVLALKIAQRLDRNVDKPKGLNKVVGA